METQEFVKYLLRNKPIVNFQYRNISDSYIPQSSIPYGPQTKITIPDNISQILNVLGEYSRKPGGKELSYILLGHDCRLNGKENHVQITEIVFDPTDKGTGQSVALSPKMLYHAKNKAEEYFNKYNNASVCLSGHTHPNGAYSDFFSFGDLEQLINIEKLWKPIIACQYGIFVVAGSKNNNPLPTPADYKYVYFDNGLYQFKETIISKELIGKITDVSKDRYQ